MVCDLRMKEHDYPKVWLEQLRPALMEIFQMDEEGYNAEPVRFMSLYNLFYHLSIAAPRDYTFKIIDDLGTMFHEYIQHKREIILASSEPFVLISNYALYWVRFKFIVERVNGVAYFVDKVIDEGLKGQETDLKVLMAGKMIDTAVKPLGILARDIWKLAIIDFFKNSEHNRLVKAIMLAIKSEREGIQKLETKVLQLAIQSFEECDKRKSITHQNIYDTDVEAVYIEETVDYYRRETSEYFSQPSLPQDYILYAIRRLEEENSRADRLLLPSSKSKVVSAYEHHIVLEHHQQLLAYFEKLLTEHKHSAITSVYLLMKQVNGGIGPMLDVFERNVINFGRKQLQTAVARANLAKDPRPYVCTLMDFYDQYKEMICAYCLDDAGFKSSLGKAMSALINHFEVHSHLRPAELVARYCDRLFDAESHDLNLQSSENKIKSSLKRANEILPYLIEKDAFQHVYSMLTASRLLYQHNISEQFEAIFAELLYELRGVEYMGKLHKMLGDLKNSRELDHSFHKLLKTEDDIGFDMNVTVLTAVAWPIPFENICEQQNLPVRMKNVAKRYHEFYTDKHRGRRLVWLHHLSRVVLRYYSLDKLYELTVSMSQLQILRRLAEGKVALDKLAPNVELKYALKFLVDHDLVRVIDEQCSLNANFKAEKVKHVVCPPTLQAPGEFNSVEDETSASHSLLPSNASDATLLTPSVRREIDEDRRHYLHALLNRIMKEHRELSPNRLLQLAVEACIARGSGFVPEVGQVGIAIEFLIDKQFLEYSKRRDVYLYIA